MPNNPENPENPRALLKQYADTLTANTQATTQNEKDEAADDLIEIQTKMEAQGQQIAELIHQLLQPPTP